MRPGYLLWCACAVLLVTGAGGKDAPAPVKLAIELSDGSRVIGEPSIDSLKLSTSYADMEISLAKLRSIEFSSDKDYNARASLLNGDVVNARLAATEISMKTIFGEVKIPLAMVRRMRVAVSSGAAMPEGLVLHYTFNSDDGGKVIDSSESGNDGTLHGAVYAAGGKSGGGAMSFNGTRAAVVAKNMENLRLQDFTIMAWVKRGSMQKISNTWPQAPIFGYGESGYDVGIDNNGTFFVGKVGVNAVFSPCKIGDDSFHHIAVSKKGSKVMFYLDGVTYAGEDYGETFEFNTDVGVGARPDTFEASFLGLIDEVAVFNRVLSDDEVKGIYESQK